MKEDTPFLSRWARRKAEVREGRPVADVPPVPSPAPPAAPQAEVLPVQAPPAPAEPPALTLDDVEQLDTRTGDFTRFVRPSVAPDVRNAALKKLFQADPHFNLMDGLDVYIDDYNKPDPLPASMLRQMVQSKFLGLFSDEDEPDPKPAAAATATAPRHEDENADLRLQPDDAAGRPGPEPGPGPDADRQH